MNTGRIRTLVASVGAALAALALLAPVASADTPKAGYERFAGCPSAKEHAELLCIRGVIDGGHFQMGSKDVPITKPITLSGGASFNNGAVFATAAGGMSAAKQQVPGGVIGITGLDWLVNFLGIEALKLYATTELAGQPFVGQGSETIKLPIRVHLENTALGKNCYVGTFTNPIVLNMTFGTTSPPPPNKPISGTFPTFTESDLEEVFLLKDGVLVDNSFAAPGASGCVLTLFGIFPISINGLVNSQSGLPAAAGTNETKQNVDLELAGQETVYP